MPALVFVHGGPIRQMMPGWHPMSFYHLTYELNQYLASRGYAVLEVNYRLGVGYGRAWRHQEHGGPFGAAEYQDVVAAARYLAARPDVDGARLGIWGGSYGGLLTSLALARDSATFHAGVDLCGVHDWSRFLPAEQLHDDAMKHMAQASSAVSAVATWTSPVLFVHGDDDQNVPFHETVDLVQRLRDAGKAHIEILVYPDEQHGEVVHARWLQIADRAADFFDRELPVGPPR
jgi:dipeptidyl aminopeptidase/acylaminoacyl peptidase